MADNTDDTSRDNSCPCCLSATGDTGLGLAIVKHSLYHHQAQLDITSTPGVGSRFAAHFPASPIARF